MYLYATKTRCVAIADNYDTTLEGYVEAFRSVCRRGRFSHLKMSHVTCHTITDSQWARKCAAISFARPFGGLPSEWREIDSLEDADIELS